MDSDESFLGDRYLASDYGARRDERHQIVRVNQSILEHHWRKQQEAFDLLKLWLPGTLFKDLLLPWIADVTLIPPAPTYCCTRRMPRKQIAMHCAECQGITPYHDFTFSCGHVFQYCVAHTAFYVAHNNGLCGLCSPFGSSRRGWPYIP